MKLLTSLALAAAIALPGTVGTAQGVINGETLNEGSSSHATLSAISAALEQSGNGVIQIQSGQTLTKSLLNIALGRTAIGTIPTAAYMVLDRGVGPYKDLGEQGVALAENVQALIGFQPGLFVPIVFQDSGIATWQDMKGKKIFTGPPSGTAAVNTRTMIEAVTGFKAGEDYEEVLLDWAAAQQAMWTGSSTCSSSPQPSRTRWCSSWPRPVASGSSVFRRTSIRAKAGRRRPNGRVRPRAYTARLPMTPASST